MSKEHKLNQHPSLTLKNGGTPERALKFAKFELKYGERNLQDSLGTEYEDESRELVEHFKGEIKYWEEKLRADPTSNNEDDDE